MPEENAQKVLNKTAYEHLVAAVGERERGTFLTNQQTMVKNEGDFKGVLKTGFRVDFCVSPMGDKPDCPSPACGRR